MADIEFKPLPAKEAVDYFRKKGYKTTFDWHEMQRDEHAYNFTVAKVTQLDILQDIRQSVDQAIANGRTFKDFAKDLTPVLQEKGWWGKKLAVDPSTGEEREVQLGSPRRLKTIYSVNLRSAYSAGRWEQAQRVKKNRPYLAYRGIDDARQRASHRQFNDTVLPVDHPFWDTHYPPNDYGCRCSVQQLSDRDVSRLGLTVSKTSPTGAPRTFVDNRTGETVLVPPGVSPDFAYNVGKARMKAMVPPALDKPLSIPFNGDLISTPAPAARKLDQSRMLPDNLSEEEYVRAFLKEFGGDIGKPVTFKDAAGETILISDDLFKTANGAYKVKRRGRHQFLLLLADAIKQPDEIFWVWQEYPKGRMTLNKIYLTRWIGDAGEIGGYTMFDTAPGGWNGVTTFKADDVRYIEKQRRGSLVYRRTQK